MGTAATGTTVTGHRINEVERTNRLLWGGFELAFLWSGAATEPKPVTIRNKQLQKSGSTAATGENLSPKLVKTFRGGKYTSRVLNEPEIFYRYHGVNNRLRPVTFVSKTKYSSKEFMRIRLAIKKKWGININKISKMKVPSGVRIFEGQAASQGLLYIGGGHQAVIMHPSKSWILNTIVF